MSKTLVIVESPAKAKTIGKYLGAGYNVRASVGHVRDLPKSNKKAIDIKAGFVPHYEISKGKEKIVSELITLAKSADKILLASDADREGEAIAWHVRALIDPKGKKTKRITYHEITKEAIEEAIEHPRAIDENLRRAQEARRVLDRLVGYDLSGLIWKKVRYGLSAGRVQSPALRILAEREREINNFIPEKYFVLTANTKTTKNDALTLTSTEEPKTEERANEILKIAKNNPWSVVDVTESEMHRTPKAPFITSTLQQTASSRLGFSPSRTMGIAQKLYEAGLITYMRTDSTNLATVARTSALSVIAKKYGANLAVARDYAKKVKNAQEAHEAIRPTHLEVEHAGFTPEQKKLYELIWQRTISSQMADAVMMRTKIIGKPNDDKSPEFHANGSRVLSPGWLLADPESRGEDVELPKVLKSETLTLVDISSLEKATEPPPRYTEAGLIKELEKRGIGRPSTYASIMRTLEERSYVTKEGRALKPTDVGMVVSTFLEENFTDYISDSFTAEMEDKLDDIANGDREYEKTLREFYTPFTKVVKQKSADAKKITNLGDAPSEFACPICSSGMVWKLSRNGKFMSCKRFPDCAGARTLEGKELAPPKEIGEMCPDCKEGKLVIREGRFGTFVSCARYPKCKFIKEDEAEVARKKTGVACPVCKTGEMMERRGKFGIFYSCTNYPTCKNAIKAKPTGKICGECGSLMMEGTKTIPERCSNKICPNHNPHKIGKKS